MPSTTPPKGLPTPGRRDRNVAARARRSRNNAKKFVWAVIAVLLLVAILVIGTGSGGNLDDGTQTTTNVVLPLLLLSRVVRVTPAARS